MPTPTTRTRPDHPFTTTAWWTLAVLILLTLVAAGVRAATDVPHLRAGTLPDEDSFEYRYVLHSAIAYAHIGLGVVYFLGAPLQLSRRFRTAHYTAHRRIGRVILPAGIGAGVFGIVAGTLFPFGGFGEASATIIFGHYYVIALATAYLAIKRGDVVAHRRWMIRAFAVALGVGTIRLWIGLLQGLQLLSFPDSFAAAFWLSFPLHAFAAEVYLRYRPAPDQAAPSTAEIT